MLKLYNSYSNSLEEVLLSKDKVKVYFIGPTVQWSPHIGHGRSAVVFDFFIRYLKYLDFNISFVRNITDIEWDDIAESAPAILAMIAMPLTYSISNGIALAFVSYALIKIFTGKFSSTSPAIFIIAILSVISFAVA